MQILKEKELKRLIEKNGWVQQSNSKHCIYKHPVTGDTISMSHRHTMVPPGKKVLHIVYKKILQNGGHVE